MIQLVTFLSYGNFFIFLFFNSYNDIVISSRSGFNFNYKYCKAPLSSGNEHYIISFFFKKETTFFILQNMFRHSYVIFSCKCSTVIHLNFHCMHDYVIELCHKNYGNNLKIGIHWEQRLRACQQ